MDNSSGSTVSNSVTRVKNKVVADIEKMLDELKPLPSSEGCIYLVPMQVRKVNEEAYTPRIVSIGPFHYNNKNLKSMEEVKKRYMKKLVRTNGNCCLDSCFDFVKNREEDIRNCYSERIEMDSREFNIMVLVDSCFIIQFLISFYNWTDNDDDLLSLDRMTCNNIVLDLILLENQVPFFVLKELCTLITFEGFSFLDLALNFLTTAANLHLFEGFKINNIEPLHIQSINHFTHLLLILYQPPYEEQPQLPNEICQDLHSATSLTNAGVTFLEERFNNGPFDITFSDEVLKIPSLLLHYDTEILIRNLMALELYQDPKESFVGGYLVFMAHLINTTKDVNLLVEKKILINNLGDDKAAANFFKKLCINVICTGHNLYFSRLCKVLNDYYNHHRFRAMLNRDYWHTPLKKTATTGATMLLVLTIIQTACSIISTIQDNY
ncbi:hypothetical protein LguiB_027662 [Lonicera macranthoides]